MNPTRWIALTVRAPSDELAAELAEGLVSLGGLAVQQDVDGLTTYFPEPEDPDGFLAVAADRLASIAGVEPEILWRWQDDEDWGARWKEGLEPRRVGQRIVVTQPWNPVDAGDDDVVLDIEPSSAFGTGEHATTRGALRLLEAAITGGERVLDIGAGSAILSLAAVGLGARSVRAVESDAGAMATATANIARAGAGDRVRLENAIVDGVYLDGLEEGAFDVIVANILSSVLTPLLSGLRRALAADGRLILGGIMGDEVAEVRAAADAAGLEVTREDREEGWWTGVLCPRRR